MSLNASTTSVIINSLVSGGIYTARVAGLTHIGSGPFSNPSILNMDPSQLSQQQQPPQLDSSYRGSIVQETWFTVFLVLMLFSILVAVFGVYCVKRRKTLSKHLGHLNVPVSTTNNICQMNKDSLWLERGWRPTNNLPTGSSFDHADKDCETKLLNKHALSSNIVGMQGCEYAEVNLTTFYNTRKPSAPPEPYATTTLCMTSRSPDSLGTSGQKSSSSDSCLKPDYSSLESAHEHNKSTLSPSSDNVSSVYTDEIADYTRRQQSQQPQLPNWCDLLPPPPEHPPPSTSTAASSFSSRLQQEQQEYETPVASPNLNKRTNNSHHGLEYNFQNPPTPPLRYAASNSCCASSTSWVQLESAGQQQQSHCTNIPKQTNLPPVSSFPQTLDSYESCQVYENEYESGSLMCGYDQNGLNSNFHSNKDDWDRKSCDSNSHSDVCCSCSEYSCLYADTIDYEIQQQPTLVPQQRLKSGAHQISSHLRKSRVRVIPRNRSSSPNYSTDSNYSCIRQKTGLAADSPTDQLKHNHDKDQVPFSAKSDVQHSFSTTHSISSSGSKKYNRGDQCINSSNGVNLSEASYLSEHLSDS